MVDAELLADIPAELLTARDALAALDLVASCRIGLEAGISPDHYPLVRLVPARFTPGKPYHGRTCEVLVYFGDKIAASQGLEEVYRGLFAMEKAILDTLRGLNCRYVETITDEDRLDTYKLMAIRCEMPIANTAPA
jgi:hypothetical protein